VKDQLGSAEELRLNAKESMRARTGAGGDSFGDLLLEEKNGALEQGAEGQGFFDDRRGDVVGEISNNSDGSPLREVGLEHIALDDGEPRLIAKFRAQILNKDGVDLDGDDAGGSGEEVVGESASPRSDFDYDIGGVRARVIWARQLGNAFEDFFANEEVLTQPSTQATILTRRFAFPLLGTLVSSTNFASVRRFRSRPEPS